MALKNLQVNIGANTSGFNKGVKNVQRGIKSMSSGFSAMKTKALVVTASITALAVASTKLMQAYAGLRNSVQRANELFKDSNKYIKYFADNTSKAFGMSETTAYQYAATYGNLFKGITKDTDENAKVTIAMMKASAVISSKTGRTMEDVNERIRSGILGNTEAIEDLGINVPVAMLKTTNAFKRIADTRPWESLTYQEQQQIRVLAILEQSSSQYGDSVSQISGMSLPRLGQAFKDLVSYAGMFVTNALQPIINALGRIVHWATAALKSLASVMGLKLEGDLASPASDGALAQSDFAEATDDTTKAIKKQQGLLSGFDVINTLSEPSSSSSSSGGGGDSGSSSAFSGIEMPEFNAEDLEIDTSSLEKGVNKAKSVISSLIKFISSKFAPSLSGWKDAFLGLSSPISNAFSSIKTSFSNFWTSALQPFSSYLVGTWIPDIANSFSNTFAPIFQDVMPVLIRQFALEFEFATTSISNIINDILTPAFDLMKTIATDVFEGIKTSWDEHGAGILEGFENFRESLREIWNNLYDNIFKPVFEKIGQIASWLWDKHLKKLWDNITDFVGSVGEFVLMLWNEFLAPVVNFIVKKFGPPITFIIGMIGDVFATVFAWISDIVGGFLKLLSGLMDFLTGVFTGDWDKAWEGIKKIVIGIWDMIWGGIKGTINLIIDGINMLWGGIYHAVKGIVDSIGGIAGALGDLFGQDWRFSMPDQPPLIPKLAKGGIIDRPTVAMVGEAGKEAVMPLENNTGWIDQLAQKISMSINTQGGASGDIHVYIGNDELDNYIVQTSRKNAILTNGRA